MENIQLKANCTNERRKRGYSRLWICTHTNTVNQELYFKFKLLKIDADICIAFPLLRIVTVSLFHVECCIVCMSVCVCVSANFRANEKIHIIKQMFATNLFTFHR